MLILKLSGILNILSILLKQIFKPLKDEVLFCIFKSINSYFKDYDISK